MAESQDQAQEKTEQPTAKRLLDARKKGQVPRSRDFNTLVSLLAASCGALMLGPALLRDVMDMLRSGLQLPRAAAFDEGAPLISMQQFTMDAASLLGPLLALLLVCTFIGPVLLGGWTFSPQALAPKLERIGPLKGLKRIFAARSLVELAKTILKFLVVGALAAATLWQLSDWLLLLPLSPLTLALPEIGAKFSWVFLVLSCGMIIIAAVDVPFQLWDHTKKLRMSRQEIKDELKETEGRPEIKGHIRFMQQQAAQQRMMQDVPRADVVITNPTHFAVALRYQDGEMNAPVVVARGRDLIAARIREIAQENGVTIFSAPPLARALYASTELGQEVPPKLFVAVAKVLAYVFQLRSAMGTGAAVKMPDLATLLADIPADGDATL